MVDMWKNRQPPTPLDFDAIMSGTFIYRPTIANGGPNGSTNTPAVPPSESNGQSSQAVLRDQRKLSLKDNLELFVSR